MRNPARFGKDSKLTLGLVTLLSSLLFRCVDFAPDMALGALGGGGGAGGQVNAAGCGARSAACQAGSSGSPIETMGGESGADSGAAGASAGAGADSGAGGVSGEAGTGGDIDHGEAGSDGVSAPLAPLRPERSLIETNPEALVYLTMERVLERATAEDSAFVYEAFALSFAERSDDQNFPGPRCDDEQPSSDGLSTLNGFSVACPSEAANLYWQLTAWRPLSVTNRFDLAPAGGENCGEQHLGFYYDTSGSGQPEFPLQGYLRFEAVIANPAPELGLEGCRPLIDFWASLGRSEYDSPDLRARAFELAFLGTSLPASATPSSPELSALMKSGIQPLISPAHFGHVGRLQLLYLGDKGDWHFFEDALVSSKEGFVLRRPLTQTLPVAALLDDHPKREQCVNELLSSIPGLLNEDVNLLRLDIDPACFDATNTTLDTTLADGLWSAPLGSDLQARLDDHMGHYYPNLGLAGRDIALRAEFAGTCSGCHNMPESIWSNPSSVSHVSRNRLQACAASGPDATRRCYARSPLLDTIFIPHWLRVLEDYYQRLGNYGPLPNGAASTVAIDGAPLSRQNP